MSIIRRGPLAAEQFVMVSNAFARDNRLSLQARGLGLWLFSHQDGWELSILRIAEQVGCGKDRVQRCIKELEECGYLTREQVRDSESNRWGETVYTLVDAVGGFSADGEAGTGKAVDRKTGMHKKTNSKNTILKNTNPAAGAPVGEFASNDGGLFDAPKPSKPSGVEPKPEKQAITRLVEAFHQRMNGMINHDAVRGVCRKALDAGYPEQAVQLALGRIADARWPLTAERLRIELEGGPRRPGAPAPIRNPSWVDYNLEM